MGPTIEKTDCDNAMDPGPLDREVDRRSRSDRLSHIEEAKGLVTME